MNVAQVGSLGLGTAPDAPPAQGALVGPGGVVGAEVVVVGAGVGACVVVGDGVVTWVVGGDGGGNVVGEPAQSTW